MSPVTEVSIAVLAKPAANKMSVKLCQPMASSGTSHHSSPSLITDGRSYSANKKARWHFRSGSTKLHFYLRHPTYQEDISDFFCFLLLFLHIHGANFSTWTRLRSRELLESEFSTLFMKKKTQNIHSVFKQHDCLWTSSDMHLSAFSTIQSKCL